MNNIRCVLRHNHVSCIPHTTMPGTRNCHDTNFVANDSTRRWLSLWQPRNPLVDTKLSSWQNGELSLCRQCRHSCRFYTLRCCQWRKSWHHDNSPFSVREKAIVRQRATVAGYADGGFTLKFYLIVSYYTKQSQTYWSVACFRCTHNTFASLTALSPKDQDVCVCRSW